VEVEQIIKLIKVVSESPLTLFEYEEEGCKLHLGKESIVYEREAVEYNTVTKSNTKEPVNIVEDKAVNCITSPMVGTFYSSKEQGKNPYITVGDVVKKGQIIGIVEAMKLMNEIESPYDGVVEEILVSNEEMVEYLKPLVIIREVE
jgi:acetyl-CoA carboxylase biotin carboxyl carrier protein